MKNILVREVPSSLVGQRICSGYDGRILSLVYLVNWRSEKPVPSGIQTAENTSEKYFYFATFSL